MNNKLRLFAFVDEGNPCTKDGSVLRRATKSEKALFPKITGCICVDENGTIFGIGRTEKSAIADAVRNGGSPDYRTMPATARLLKKVRVLGAGCPWTGYVIGAKVHADID